MSRYLISAVYNYHAQTFNQINQKLQYQILTILNLQTSNLISQTSLHYPLLTTNQTNLLCLKVSNLIYKALRILNIKGNHLKTIHVQDLEQLDVSDNKLEIIEQNINHLQQFKVGWLKVINQNESLELSTIKTLKKQIIHFSDFLNQAIQLMPSYIFDNNIINQCILTNNEYYFNLILPFYKWQNEEETPLCLAIKKLKLEFISKLMSSIEIKLETQAFHEAIKQGQVSLVKQFLEMGVDPNAYSNKGLTPLTTAALNITQTNMEMIVHLLIQSRANPNKLNRNGFSLIQMLIIKSNLTGLRFILNLNKNKNNYIKFKMNIKGINGDYPLHTAVQSVSITQFLLNNQIGNVFSVNYSNITAKQISSKQERTVIYKLLQKEERYLTLKQIRYHQHTIKEDNSSSSCPELSDDEMPNRPKINKKYLTEMCDLSYDVLQQSEDDECKHDCSSESEIQWPRDNLRILKLQQLNHQNQVLNRSQVDIRQRSIMLNKLNKRRLTYNQYQYYTREGQGMKEKNSSICILRNELQLFGTLKYKDALLSHSEEYLKNLNQQINRLECDLEDTLLGQYLIFQQFQYFQ